MGAIKVHEFTTIDGSVSAPMWTFPFGFTDEMGAALAEITGSSLAILLGRNTYQMFYPAWSTRTVEEDPGAPFFNDSPKYVVSSTLTDADAPWNNSTVLGAYDADALRKFKDTVDGGIYVSGSATLVRALLADGLVDELHLFVYPVTVGDGPRLSLEGAPQSTLALGGCEAYSNGVVHLTYVPAPAQAS